MALIANPIEKSRTITADAAAFCNDCEFEVTLRSPATTRRTAVLHVLDTGHEVAVTSSKVYRLRKR